MEFGKRLVYFRLKKGLTQCRLATLCKTSNKTTRC